MGLVVSCSGALALADPPPAASGTSTPTDAQPLTPQGSFFSSLKQGFAQDSDHEVVRGHFDVGSGSDAHRYYCLVNPKTGKREDYGVAGELVHKRNGMTGITGVAVTQFRCADAEQKGLLDTTGYLVPASSGGKSPAAAASAPPAPAAVAPPVAAAPLAAVPALAAPVASAEPAASGSEQTEVMAVYSRFIAGQNAHDRAAVSQLLLDSKDFVWAQYGGSSVWGYKAALDEFEAQWRGTWILDPQTKELRVANVAPGVAVLITPLLFTEGPSGKTPSTVSIRWGGVFVKTNSGWRISSIFITPWPSVRGASGG